MWAARQVRAIKQASKVRPLRQFSTKGAFQGSFDAAWNNKLAGAIIGASGVVVCIFGLGSLYQNAYAADERKKRIVVLGSGWGAVSFLKNLKPDLYEVVVVSPTNYFLFTPFLASVTVGTVEARTICEPIRKILGRKHKSSACFYEAECTDIDVEKKQITCLKEQDEGILYTKYIGN